MAVAERNGVLPNQANHAEEEEEEDGQAEHKEEEEEDEEDEEQQNGNEHPVFHFDEEDSKSTGEWWQCALGTVKQRMAAIHYHGRLSDVILVFPKQHSELKAHKLVLAMSSPVMEAMLFRPLSNDTDGTTHRLNLDCDYPDIFEWILRYLYRDDTRFKGTQQALGVYEAAHRYQMEALVKLCSRYLADSVDTETFPFVFQAAVLHDDAELLHRCYELAAMQGQEVLECSDLCVLSRAAFHSLLICPRLYVNKESIVFHAIVQWGWAHLDDELPATDDPSHVLLPAHRRLRAVIDEFLPHVRFLAMDLNEFMHEVEKSNVLNPAECIAVVQALRSSRSFIALPHFVSPDATRRREALVNVVHLVYPPSNEILTLNHHDNLSINLIQKFTTSSTVHLVRLASTGVCTLKEGKVMVWDEDGGHVARGDWVGNNCLFRRPVTLLTGRQYSAVLTVKEVWCAVTNAPITVTHKRTTFHGETQLGGRLKLEYIAGIFLPPPNLERRQPPIVCAIDT